MAISEETKKMRAALKEIVIPYLREQNFKGTYPHFRRIGKEKVDLMTFQSGKWGGFRVNLGIGPLEGVVRKEKLIPPDKLTVYNGFGYVTLTIDEYHVDCLFGYVPSCEAVAYEVRSLIEKRADLIFDRMYNRKLAFESLTPEQYSEFEELLKENMKTRYYSFRNCDGPSFYMMNRLILEYIDGSLKFFIEFFKTLTPEQIEALEWKLKLKYRCEYFLREPKYKNRKYDRILNDLLGKNMDEETVLLFYSEMKNWRCISTNEMI